MGKEKRRKGEGEDVAGREIRMESLLQSLKWIDVPTVGRCVLPMC